jgi:predicted aminopeptidase
VAVEEALKREDLPAKSKASLSALQDILNFAQDAGLQVGDSYRYLIFQQEKAVSYSVQAAHADRLEFVTWWFPFVGRVPYLGFYSKNERDLKYNGLAAQGYDVAKGAVSGFSGLGWFSDPIFSSMLERPIEDFAHLIFHELTHKTFWISNSAEFNENLAEFVARDLTLKYLSDRNLMQASVRYSKVLADRGQYQKWLFSLRQELKRLYASKIDKAELLRRKKAIFAAYTSVKLPKFNTGSFDFVRVREWNNAYVLAAGLYTTDLRPFDKAYACAKKPSFGKFLAELESFAKETGNGLQALENFCK